MRPRWIHAGFTLVELVMVVAILALLAGIAVPRMDWDALGTVQTEAVAQTFARTLRLTRSLAIANSGTNPVGYRAVVSAGSYRILDARTSTAVYGPVILPSSVQVTGIQDFPFTPLGEISGTGALEVTFIQSSGDSTVRVTPIGHIKVLD